MVAELKCWRSQGPQLAAERDAVKGQLDVLNMKFQLAMERGDFFKDAATKGLKVDSNNGLILANKDTEIRVCTARNADLEKENAGLRSSRNIRTLLGFGAGVGVGVFATHQFDRRGHTVILK
jgi:hypothetical protein